MINTKKIYNKLLNDERIIELVNEENIFNAWPSEFETFPCIIFMDENQSNDEYYENMPGASRCSVQIHIFSKKLDGYITTSDIAIIIAKVMNEDLWNCSQNGEITDVDLDCEHRIMVFNKSIFN